MCVYISYPIASYLLGLLELLVGVVELLCILVPELVHQRLVAVRLLVHRASQLRHLLLTLAAQLLCRRRRVQRVFQLALQRLQLLKRQR